MTTTNTPAVPDSQDGNQTEAHTAAQTEAKSIPVTAERIEALDVVRGFALVGITLMNIEFFNRPIHSMGSGMPTDLHGLDWLASFFIAYFVQGKFWTIFSTLFGMGFAVMLLRAESAGRDFLPVYLRRILGLMVFGAAHYIFLWDGDILFSYSVAAIGMMVVLWGRWKPLVAAIAVLFGLGFIPGMNPLMGIAGALMYMGLISIYLRSERMVTIRGRAIPLFSLILGIVATVAVIAAVLLWTLPGAPKGPRVPATIMAIMLTPLSILSAKYRGPFVTRSLRLAIAGFLFSAITGTLFGAAQYFMPPPAAPVAVNAAAPTEAEKVAIEKYAKEQKDRTERIAKRKKEIDEEIRILSKGNYAEAVMMRAEAFPQKAANDSGFATILVCMFLLGAWFVRSGVMNDTRAHLPLFRKMAMYGLPVGIGIGLLGSLVATSSVPGATQDGYNFAHGLTMVGNLPASLGYIGLVIVMLHSATLFAKIRVLAPFGRMALTNYLTQSLVCTLVFYGYGLAHFGLPRAQQVVFVLTLVAVQVAFSHWWLARFRYGPMEWLWRGFTYRTVPAMRL